MKQFANEVYICGDLVENNLEEAVDKNDNEVIRGNLKIRTSDSSEHVVNYYCSKYRKDSNGNVTNEESKSYSNLEEALSFKDMKNCSEGELPDVVRIYRGRFNDNTYKPKGSNNVIEGVKIFAQGVYLISPNDYDTTEKNATFKVEGLIESIKDETEVKDNGETKTHLKIKMNLLNQRNSDYSNENGYEPTSLFPLDLKVDSDLVNGFRSVGYYDGCVTDFTGIIVNVKKVEEFTENRAFGGTIVKTKPITVHNNEIETGGTAKNIYELDLTDEIVNALVQERKVKIESIKNDTGSTNNAFSKPKTEAPKMGSNPFNPFAK